MSIFWRKTFCRSRNGRAGSTEPGTLIRQGRPEHCINKLFMLEHRRQKACARREKHICHGRRFRKRKRKIDFSERTFRASEWKFVLRHLSWDFFSLRARSVETEKLYKRQRGFNGKNNRGFAMRGLKTASCCANRVRGEFVDCFRSCSVGK